MNISSHNPEGYPDPTVQSAFSGVSADASRRPFSRPFGYWPMVYICSPFASDPEGNTEKALRYCRFAVSQRTIPLAPHLLFPRFLREEDPYEREIGLFCGRVLLTKCTEIWAFGNVPSPGMSEELRKAKNRGMVIRYFTEDCREVRCCA